MVSKDGRATKFGSDTPGYTQGILNGGIRHSMEQRGKTPSYLPLVCHLRSAFDQISYASMSPRVLGLITANMIDMSEVILSRVMYYCKSSHIYTSIKVKCYTIPQLGLFASRCLLWGIRIKQGLGNTEDLKLRNCSSHLRCIKVEFHN